MTQKNRGRHPMERQAEQDQKYREKEEELADWRIKKDIEEMDKKIGITSEETYQIDKEEEVMETLTFKNLTVEILNPNSSWEEIKSYHMDKEFVLQPVYHPIRGEKEVENKKTNEIETKRFEKMGILLLLQDKKGKRDILFPYNLNYSKSTFYINGSKYKIPSEPFPLKSLPTKHLLKRFLDGETVNGHVIWKNFKEYRMKYLDVGEDHRKYILQTAWDLCTHFHMLFNGYGYQDFFGFRGSGKNRSHEICDVLCFHAIMVGTTRSISSIFRSIDAMGSTWLKNEAEKLIGKNRDNDLLELCLEGYKKGSPIPLTSDIGKNKNRPPIFFDIYSPKSFASDKDIYGAFGTRMIKYLQQKTSGEQGKIEIDRELGQQYRDDAYILRLQEGARLAEIVEKTRIEDLLNGYDLNLVSRDREIFFPLLIIIKEFASEQEYKDAVEYIKDYLEQQKEESIDQPHAVVLRALYSVALDHKRDKKDSDEFWIGISTVREKIIFDDPEAWRLVSSQSESYGEKREEKRVIYSSETVKYFTSRKIGAILTKNGFTKKRKVGGTFERFVSIDKIKTKAATLNIKLEEDFF